MRLSGNRRFLVGILLAWALTATILLLVNISAIRTLDYPDPDDQLRLLQVRDFLGGQSWFDVTQYRMNPPFGAPMHWSRLIDLPIAAVILLMTPLFGPEIAQTIAAIVVPMVTLGLVMALVALVTRRLIGQDAGVLAALLASTSFVALQQLRPLRVDHHGWQIAFALATLLAVLDDRPKRSGLAAGAMLAVWLQVSLEGLPFAAATAAVLAIRWGMRGNVETVRFQAFAIALAAGSFLLFGAMHAPAQWPTIYCDAISPPHLAVFAIGGIGTLAIVHSPLARTPLLRFLHLAVLGILCLAAFRAIAPVCSGGAFAQLEPLVYNLWYQKVDEGLPLWRQDWATVTGAIGFPLVGLTGAVIGLRGSDPARRDHWIRYLMLLVAAIVITILIQRAGAATNMLALPGGMAIVTRLLARTQASASILLRVVGSSAVILLFSPTAPLLLWAAVGQTNEPAPKHSGGDRPCATTAIFRRLDALPTGTMLAELDLGPRLLLETRHRAIASGHHRNHKAMEDVIRAFTGPPQQAHDIIRRRRIDYVLVCPDLGEVDVYTRYAPKGFMAQLLHRPAPPWLRRVIVPDTGGVHLWKVVG